MHRPASLEFTQEKDHWELMGEKLLKHVNYVILEVMDWIQVA